LLRVLDLRERDGVLVTRLPSCGVSFKRANVTGFEGT